MSFSISRFLHSLQIFQDINNLEEISVEDYLFIFSIYTHHDCQKWLTVIKLVHNQKH